METPRFIPLVMCMIIVLYVPCVVGSSRSLSLLLNEAIKNQVRQEMSGITTDILAIYGTLDELKKAVGIANNGAHNNGLAEKDELEKVKNNEGSDNQMKINEEMMKKYKHLHHAFQTEKRLNRELERKLNRFKDNIASRISLIVSNQENTDKNVDNVREDVNKLDEKVTAMGSEGKKCAENIDIISTTVKDFDKKIQSIAGDVQKVDGDLVKVVHDVKQVTENIGEGRQTIKTVSDNLNELNVTVQNIISTTVKDFDKKSQSIAGDVQKVDGDLVNVVHDVKQVTENINKLKPKLITNKKLSCKSVPESGVYDITFDFMESPVPVYCDQDTDGGGWIVILRRKDGTENFYRSWADYKNGFGNKEGEFWAGNDIIHELTKSKQTQLRIDMGDFNGDTAYAQYEHFEIGPEDDKYRLKVSDFSGTAGDSLIEVGIAAGVHNGHQFSTFDSDNDYSDKNCADRYKGGWWFYKCFRSHLTHVYSHTGEIAIGDGIIWYAWKGYESSLKFVEMKIRHE